MSRQIQIRRGTAAENDAFTGAIGEVTMDTTNKTLRVHDGITAGGTVLAKQSEIPTQQTLPENYDFVIESQAPTAANNYTWYRKYKSGWVEQGGQTPKNTGGTSVTLSVTMADANYSITCSLKNAGSNHTTGGYDRYPGTVDITTTGFWMEQPSNANYYTCWEVKGMAAA